MKKVTLAILLFVALTSLTVKRNLPIKVANATKKAWVSGADGRTGTDYKIKVMVNDKGTVNFTGLWIGKQQVSYSVEFYTGLMMKDTFTKGDSLMLTYNWITGEGPDTERQMQPPITYKGAALIGAKVNGKQRYFIVSSFREEKKLMGR
jgi:hypothetical protein